MLRIDRKTHIVVRMLIITAGALLYAVGIALFLDPNSLAPGGVTGIAIMINHLTGLSTGVMILCINIPLLVIGVWKFGFKFLLTTIYAIVVSSGAMDFLATYGAVTEDKLLAAVAGSVIMAIGMGLIYKCGATTGGMDIVVRLIKLRYKHIRTGRLFLLTDMFIVAASAVVFNNLDLGLYAAIAVFICSTVFDMVLYGADGAKLVYIMTTQEAAITQRILDELEIGVTQLQGVGAYTDTEKRVIMCAMRKQLLPMVQDIATEEDPYAFLIITSASEIFGEGFKDIRGERL